MAIRWQRPSHVVSLLAAKHMIRHHKDIAKNNHLRITVDDIATTVRGQKEPNAEHVTQILNFIGSWDQGAPLLIHCLAGISRSTAAMYMALCKLNPQHNEVDILKRMRELAPHVAPNRLLVAIADDQLGRDGRMVEALDAIGPAVLAKEGYKFELPADMNRTD
jgi:predicted protein tyrosine phosphatase